jgi:seryl-tRNA synthetase
MLDYRFIKDNLEAVKENIRNRNMKADADKVVMLFDKRNELVTRLQNLQQQRNANAAAMKGKLDPDTRNRLIEEGKKLKDDIAAAEAELETVEKELDTEAAVSQHGPPCSPHWQGR